MFIRLSNCLTKGFLVYCIKGVVTNANIILYVKIGLNEAPFKLKNIFLLLCRKMLNYLLNILIQ